MYYCQPVDLVLSHLTSSTWYVLLSARGSNPVTRHPHGMYYCQPVDLILSHLTSSTWYVLLSARGTNPVTSHVINMVCITVNPWI